MISITCVHDGQDETYSRRLFAPRPLRDPIDAVASQTVRGELRLRRGRQQDVSIQ
jgi:hypothetical protein